MYKQKVRFRVLHIRDILVWRSCTMLGSSEGGETQRKRSAIYGAWPCVKHFLPPRISTPNPDVVLGQSKAEQCASSSRSIPASSAPLLCPVLLCSALQLIVSHPPHTNHHTTHRGLFGIQPQSYRGGRARSSR
jgi:hypothetical protein